MTLARDTGNYGPLGFRPNLLINPQFNINQRVAVSGANLASIGDYFLDRWCASVTNSAPTWSGDVLTIPAGDGVKQIVEDVNMPAGTYNLSWEGTAQCNVEGLGLADSPIEFSVVGGADITIDFGPGTVQQPMLVAGTLPAPFIARQFTDELVLCKRYLQKSYELDAAPGAVTEARGAVVCRVTASGSTVLSHQAVFPVAMRSQPTIVWYSPNNGVAARWYNATGAVNVTVAGFYSSGPPSEKMPGIPQFTAGLTLGTIVMGHYTADAEL